MPISRLPNGKLLYYAHVPKCAGSAVEGYLTERFGKLGMIDTSFVRRSPLEAWSLSPPQHMPESVRMALLPDALFDALFATVRHPLLRLRSVFLFHREVEGTLPAKMQFSAWLDALPRVLTLDPYALHGHVRSMSETVPRQAHVFRIEDGLDPLVTWLDTLSCSEDGPRVIAPKNVLSKRIAKVPQIALSAALRKKVALLYAADYERFSYAHDPEEQEAE